MKTLLTILTACLLTGGFAQEINYRVGWKLGESNMYLLAGTDIKKLRRSVAVEAVAATPFTVGSAWVGGGLRKTFYIKEIQTEGNVAAGFITRVDGQLLDKFGWYLGLGVRL